MVQQVSRIGLVSVLLSAAVMLMLFLSPSNDPASCGDDAGRPGPSLAGRILDRKTGRPVTAFGIELFLEIEPLSESERLFYREFRDADGRFLIPLEQGGQYSFCVHSPCHEDVHGNKAPLIHAEGQAEVRVELNPLRSVSGRVVDAETGEPVSGATVFKYGIDLENLVTGRSSRVIHAVTDGSGEYVLGGLEESDEFPIVAVHPGHAAAQVEDNGNGRMQDIALGKGSSVSGLVLDDEGLPCPGVIIRVRDLTGDDESARPFDHCVLSDATGRYRTHPLKAGRTRVTAYSPRLPEKGYRRALPFTREERAVDVTGREVELDFGPSLHFATWRGRVVNACGLPPARTEIRLVPSAIESVDPLKWHSTSAFEYCDDAGSFEFHKLLPSRYMIEVTIEKYGFIRIDCGAVVIDAPGIVEKDILIPEEALGGKPGRGTPVVAGGVTERHDRENDSATFIFRVDPNGATVRGIHLEAPRERRLVLPSEDSKGRPVFTAPGGWHFFQSRDGRLYHFISGKRTLPPGESEFSVTVPLTDDVALLTSLLTFIFTEDGTLGRTTRIVGITDKNADGHALLGPVTR